MKTKTALVMGASSGIGNATAEPLAMARYNVYGPADGELRRASERSRCCLST